MPACHVAHIKYDDTIVQEIGSRAHRVISAHEYALNRILRLTAREAQNPKRWEEHTICYFQKQYEVMVKFQKTLEMLINPYFVSIMDWYNLLEVHVSYGELYASVRIDKRRKTEGL